MRMSKIDIMRLMSLMFLLVAVFDFIIIDLSGTGNAIGTTILSIIFSIYILISMYLYIMSGAVDENGVDEDYGKGSKNSSYRMWSVRERLTPSFYALREASYLGSELIGRFRNMNLSLAKNSILDVIISAMVTTAGSTKYNWDRVGHKALMPQIPQIPRSLDGLKSGLIPIHQVRLGKRKKKFGEREGIGLGSLSELQPSDTVAFTFSAKNRGLD